MSYYSGCDMHKSFSVFVELSEEGVIEGPTRFDHGTGELQRHLNGLPDGTPVAIETSGRWYWMADKIEDADGVPRLVNAQKANVATPTRPTAWMPKDWPFFRRPGPFRRCGFRQRICGISEKCFGFG